MSITPQEEVHIWGNSREKYDAGYVSPTSTLTQQDITAINIVTTEDIVKFEPSLVVRRRFIGDSNGTLGIRGANMFQTSRSMVFADGVPLHYLLESRWNGAPRWTMVSASEIAQVEVIYGPYSAEYSGNAMGGVVLIETAIPQDREIHIDGTYFNQEFDAYDFDDRVDGFKGFASYGDTFGDASIYFSYNHLDNTAQPQSFRDTSHDDSLDESSVSGAIFDKDAQGRDKIWYGDTGVVETTTDNYKVKFGYDFGLWQSLLNIAYEDRRSESIGQSYIKDSNGDTLWSASSVTQDGQVFSFDSGPLNENKLNRKSLSIGLRLKGDLSSQARVEANFNRFSILKDESLSSRYNPRDSNNDLSGVIKDYDNSGWSTVDVKLTLDEIFLPGMELISGLRYEAYSLGLDSYDSPDYQTGVKGDYRSRSGGDTTISAIFTQANWEISSKWDASFGLRYETYKSHSGYYDFDDVNTAEFDLVSIPSETKSAMSPKFSLGLRPKENWLLRYSLAKAYRFPIVEELFGRYESYQSSSVSDPNLESEQGLHQNFMIDKTLEHGYVRMNVFHETVKDAIESQTNFSNNRRAFIPINEVEVKGVEFIINKQNALIDSLDLRFNLSWTEAIIIDNSTAEASDIEPSEDKSLTGNTYPRMPEWRMNLLASYHISNTWDVSSNLQYASDSYGRIDNNDNTDNVYGAQDAYTRIGLKTSYQFDNQWNIGLGIDNLTNEIAYVAHPWPGRTVYLNFSFDL